MISDSELFDALLDANEGEMIMAGTLLKGLSTEEIAWVVMETIVGVPGGGVRVTLHAYWHSVFVVSKVVTLRGSTLIWGVTTV